MSQIPGPSGDWTPLSGSQFLTAAVSTALTIPSIPAGVNNRGIQYVAILIPQGEVQWIRTDGQAVVAAVSGGLALDPANGDYRVVYGLQSLRAIRVIQGAPNGSLTVEYYYFRNPT